MLYRLLADVVLVAHLGFVLFVVAGGFLILRWPGMAWVQLPSAFWGLVVEWSGWICPSTLDEYLAGVKGERRAALDKLRKTIRSIVPKAKETISYGIPAFRLDGKIVAGFAATKKGCSYFPFSGSTLGTLAEDLAEYEQ